MASMPNSKLRDPSYSSGWDHFVLCSQTRHTRGNTVIMESNWRTSHPEWSRTTHTPLKVTSYNIHWEWKYITCSKHCLMMYMYQVSLCLNRLYLTNFLYIYWRMLLFNPITHLVQWSLNCFQQYQQSAGDKMRWEGLGNTCDQKSSSQKYA